MAPPLIDHLHRQISFRVTSVCLPSSRIIVFEAISSPLCPSVRGQTRGQVPFRKFSGARIAGYNVSISSRRASPISVDNRFPLLPELLNNFFYHSFRGNEYEFNKGNGYGSIGFFLTRLLIFPFGGGGGGGEGGAPSFCRRFTFRFCFIAIFFLFFFFFLIESLTKLIEAEI